MIYQLIVSNLIILAMFLLRLKTLPPQIPLFYSLPWGESQLTDSWMIVFIPILMNSLILLNNYILKKYFLNNQLITTIVYYFNLSINISFVYIFVKIILLIT